MVLLLKKIWHGYSYLLNEVADPRTKDWPLVGNPSYGLSILLIYLAFVTKCGPCWMNRRQPYNVDRIVIIFNVIQVLACAYVFGEGLWYAWGWDYRWVCEPFDTSNNYKALKVAEFVYHYYLLKYMDLFDTVFFILRKKYNQASFLHLFHHFNVVIMAWLGVTFLPGGHGTFILIINSFVHVVMYTYYLLTIADPSVKQSIWWKKHITQLQIVQLAWCAFHMITPLFKSDCNYPLVTTALFVPSDLFVLVLFLDFYYRAYIKTPVRKPDKKEVDDKDTKSVTNEEDSIKGYDVISKGELNQDVHYKNYGGVLQKSVLSHRASISNKEP